MRYDDPVKCLHEALASAVHRDLPDVNYTQTTYKSRKPIKIERKRRPFGSEVEVKLFQELWGSTALGYGGVGGQAMTYAYTVICMKDSDMCVYFGDGGHLAYKIDWRALTDQQKTELTTAIENGKMPDVRSALNMFSGAIKPYEGYIDE